MNLNLNTLWFTLLTLSICDTSNFLNTSTKEHSLSVSALLITHAYATYTTVCTITPSYRYFSHLYKIFNCSVHFLYPLKFLCRVSCPMLNPVPKSVHFLDNHVPKSVHFLDYLNFGVYLEFFLWSVSLKLCNLALVICLLI